MLYQAIKFYKNIPTWKRTAMDISVEIFCKVIMLGSICLRTLRLLSVVMESLPLKLSIFYGLLENSLFAIFANFWAIYSVLK